MDQAVPRATFRQVFAVREFRALWSAQVFSVIGDRLALVALTVLVFDRSHSPLLTSVAYAAGYVPWLVGALALAGLVLLLFVTTMFAPPFESARAAITPETLRGDRYVLGTAVVQTTFRAGLVAGAAAEAAARRPS